MKSMFHTKVTHKFTRRLIYQEGTKAPIPTKAYNYFSANLNSAHQRNQPIFSSIIVNISLWQTNFQT